MFSTVLSFVQVVEGLPFQIGHSYDLAELSLWDFTGSNPLNVLNSTDGAGVPARCISSSDECTAAYTTRVTEFADMRSIFNYFDSQDSLELRGGYKGVTASVKTAFGDKALNSWFSDSAGAMGILQNRRACYSVDEQCLVEDSEELQLDPQFQSELEKLPLDSTGNNTEILDIWVDKIIKLRGTHLCRGTENGAAIKYFSWANASGEKLANCASFNICLGLSYKGYVSVDGCNGKKGCQDAKHDYFRYGNNCAAVGGNSEVASSICNLRDAGRETKFLNSGDNDSSESVIGMNFLRLDELLERYGMSEKVVSTMGHAIDYHLCLARDRNLAKNETVWQWAVDEAKPKCMCTRECHNGGILDEKTCTCKCRGDVNHGFTGPTCEETYGWCVPGEGTGNPWSAARCATNNMCQSWVWSENCGPTGVCCLTDFGGKCCPFGSSCDCDVNQCWCREKTSTNSPRVENVLKRLLL